MGELNQDTARISIDAFKGQVFLWEIVITAIVFAAAFYILKGFKKKQQIAKESNSNYNTGEAE